MNYAHRTVAGKHIDYGIRRAPGGGWSVVVKVYAAYYDRSGPVFADPIRYIYRTRAQARAGYFFHSIGQRGRIA